METEAVRRRMKMIASHFALNSTNNPIPTTHLLSMNCSGSLNTLTPRRDNRVYFARQGSASQPFFMKQGNSEKKASCGPSKCPTSYHQSNKEQPLFSRPTNMNSNLPSTYIASTKNPIPKRDNNLNLPDHPTFARPINATTTKYLSCSSQFDGSKWRPRMEVVESVKKYVMTVEVGGVNVNDIRVEVHDHNLMIKGKRPTQRKEILRGSFNIVWPLPFDADKDTISADFQDGYLRVNIPKF